MSRANRVDPWGQLHAVDARGLFTGNRGCLVDASGAIVRDHVGARWIACVTELGGRRQPLDQVGTWTPLFFLDDAVALAAGHRPCARCRPEAYRAYRDAVTAALGAPAPLRAEDLDRRLATERRRDPATRPDRGLWATPWSDVPDGAVVVDDAGEPRLVQGRRTFAFTHAGWSEPGARPRGASTLVLTPPASFAALRHGFVPVLHPTAQDG